MSVTLNPGDNVQAAIAANANGTEFIFTPGIHRQTALFTPKTSNVFTGQPGAILNGSRLLTSWTVSGATWYATGQTQAGQVVGTCDAAFPRCDLPEELFIDDVRKHHVATVGEVTTGTWFFDYAADRIYIGDDPAGHVVETSLADNCFTTWPTPGDNVTIQGLIIEKYADRAQYGTIHCEDGTGWIVQDTEVRWNHGLGIRTGHGAQILRNRVHHNGQMGIGGPGDNVLVQTNEIAYNNTAGFSQGWESGGTKFVGTLNLILRYNWVHHNILGNGLWVDIDNRDSLIEDNLVEDNDGVGIMEEISYGAIIRRNLIYRNGSWTGDPYTTPSGILVSASPNVQVYDNTLVDNGMGITAIQQSRGSGAYGAYEIENLHVHHNQVTQASGIMAGGFIQDIADQTYFTGRNNRWHSNAYVLGTGSSANFAWMDGYRTLAEWQGYSHDRLIGQMGTSAMRRAASRRALLVLDR